jgi:hypothetical protein
MLGESKGPEPVAGRTQDACSFHRRLACWSSATVLNTRSAPVKIERMNSRSRRIKNVQKGLGKGDLCSVVGFCNTPSGRGMSSHRGRTSKSRTSLTRAFVGTDESLIISASKNTYVHVRVAGLLPVPEASSTPSRDQTTAFPAVSTSAFPYLPNPTIDSATKTSISLLARQTAPMPPSTSSHMKLASIRLATSNIELVPEPRLEAGYQQEKRMTRL